MVRCIQSEENLTQGSELEPITNFCYKDFTQFSIHRRYWCLLSCSFQLQLRNLRSSRYCHWHVCWSLVITYIFTKLAKLYLRSSRHWCPPPPSLDPGGHSRHTQGFHPLVSHPLPSSSSPFAV